MKTAKVSGFREGDRLGTRFYADKLIKRRSIKVGLYNFCCQWYGTVRKTSMPIL